MSGPSWGGRQRETRSWGNTYFRFNLKEIIALLSIVTVVVTAFLMAKDERRKILDQQKILIAQMRQVATRDDIFRLHEELQGELDNLDERMASIERKTGDRIVRTVVRSVPSRSASRESSEHRRQSWSRYEGRPTSSFLEDGAAGGR